MDIRCHHGLRSVHLHGFAAHITMRGGTVTPWGVTLKDFCSQVIKIVDDYIQFHKQRLIMSCSLLILIHMMPPDIWVQIFVMWAKKIQMHMNTKHSESTDSPLWFLQTTAESRSPSHHWPDGPHKSFGVKQTRNYFFTMK